MGSFGEKLQREREMRSISLDEIAESTKISSRMLRALEEEEFKKLPGGIFNKGFVRAYSRYLGLDEEQAVTDFLAAEYESERKNREHASEDQAHLSDEIIGRNGHHRDNVYNIRASAEVTSEEPAQAAGLMTAAIVIVVVLGVGGFGWKYLRNSASAANAAQPAALKAAPLAQPVQQPIPQPITPAVSTPSTTTSDAISAKSEIPTAAASTPDASLTPATDAPAASTSNLNLVVQTTDKSWVEVKSDGTIKWQGELGASSKRSFHAEKELVIKLGNAAAVELSYNGKTLPRFSPETKTKTLTFTADNSSTR